ncbi:MAG: aminotransferase class I/II-fold pyridoxal phosphate-dependent enzyme [Bacteroidota bacterium]
MKLNPFKLERYFARYEFSAPYLLCTSDCEALSMQELLAMSDKDALKMWHDLKLGYTESQGHPVLREEISKLYQTIKPENIITLAPEEGIYIAMNCILEKNDHVISTFPGYQSLYEVANSIGCEFSKWTPREKNDWVFNIDDLQNLIRENTKLIAINFPHNPTGATITQSELEKIVGIARKKNIVIFSDEMYRLLEYDETNRISSTCDLYDNAVSLFGMSKSFGLAGLRIGWLITKNTELLEKFATYKDYTTICSSAPSEILAIMALRAKNKILKRNLGIIQDNLKLLDEFFREYSKHFEWHKPKAGPIGFPKLKTSEKVSDFCLDVVNKKGVMLLPANQYDYRGNNFRIGFARKNMPQALEKFKEYIVENY